MGLALGVQRGDRVYLNDTPLEVLKVEGYHYVKVRVNGQEFDITDVENTEVMDKVMVCSGLPLPRDNVEPMPRLIFDAPLHIRILREPLYVKTHSKAAV